MTVIQQLMQQQFIDRGSETAFLKDRYATADSEFLVIYGMLRIGKTRLLLNFSENKPRHLFS
jgi:AAA+ ATPase superfamily predicted ATPase